MEFIQHNKVWFKERVGKRLYRTKSHCTCKVCYDVFHNGVIVQDELHAIYLFDCQTELGLFYFDTKPELVGNGR